MENKKVLEKNILSPLVSFLKFIFIILLCLASALILVFPFWIFSEKAPKAYSITVLVALFLICVALIVFSILKKFRNKSDSEKKDLRFNIFRSFIIFILSAIGIVVPIIFVLSYRRILALIVFVLAFASVGVFSACVKRK